MGDCGKGYAYCLNGCCADPSSYCCNVTCNRKGLLCYVRPKSSEEIWEELLASLFGLLIITILYILIRTKGRCDWIETVLQCFDCDCKLCKTDCNCFDRCLKFINRIRRNRRNEEISGDVTVTLEPALPIIQHADRDITSDGILDDSVNENIDTQSLANITTGQSDRNTTLAAASSSSDLPSYEEVTKNDPPSYSVALLYHVTS